MCTYFAVDLKEPTGAPAVTDEMLKEGARLLGEWFGEADDWLTRSRVLELYETLRGKDVLRRLDVPLA